MIRSARAAGLVALLASGLPASAVVVALLDAVLPPQAWIGLLRGQHAVSARGRS